MGLNKAAKLRRQTTAAERQALSVKNTPEQAAFWAGRARFLRAQMESAQ